MDIFPWMHLAAKLPRPISDSRTRTMLSLVLALAEIMTPVMAQLLLEELHFGLKEMLADIYV
jgi:hypothetical protein